MRMTRRDVLKLAGVGGAAVLVGAERRGALAATGTYPVPSSIPADGSVDVTDALKDFLASVPDGSTVLFPAGAVYRIDKTLWLLGRNGLVLEGQGATLRCVDRDVAPGFIDAPGLPPPRMGAIGKRHVMLVGCTDMTLRGLTVIGANPIAGARDGAYDPDYEFQHGFQIRGGARITLTGCSSYDTHGDALQVSGQASDVLVSGCHFERTGRQGLSLTDCTRLTVSDSYIGDTARAGCDIEPPVPDWTVQDVVLERNVWGPTKLHLFSAGGKGPNVRNVQFLANQMPTPSHAWVVTRGANEAAAGGYRGPFLVANNVGLFASGSGIGFRAAEGITVTGNVWRRVGSYRRSMPAIMLDDVHGISATNNDMRGYDRVYRVDPTDCYDYTESGNLIGRGPENF